MRTRKTAHYDGPRDKHPSHGRKPRTTQKPSEVRFGLRTPQGDIMQMTPSEQIEAARMDNLNKALVKAQLLEKIRATLANAELPDHW